MHREGFMMERIVSWENLRQAYVLARRGHHHRSRTHFEMGRLEAWLQTLGREINDGTVAVGRFHRFVIHDPKRRVIHAAPFRERVLHHALMRIAGPVFEKRSIFDSYACRVGKGAHRARARAKEYTGCFRFYLKLDVRRYFDSINHDVVIAQLSRWFKDPAFLILMERIVRSYEAAPGTGVPIGSLVSQYLANGYLGLLDRFIKEELLIKGYVRYMDDMVLWSDDAALLRGAACEIECFMSDNLRLILKEHSLVLRTRDGLPFLGARITSVSVYPSRRTRRRMKLKLREYEQAYTKGRLNAAGLQRRVGAVMAVVQSMDCRAYCRKLFILNQVDA
jgi:RNA-directed DNA polymerase